MLNRLHFLERFLARTGETLLADHKRTVDKLSFTYSALDEVGLAAELRRALVGAVPPGEASAHRFWSTQFASNLLGLDITLSSLSLRNIALATEAFARVPADLPAGSRLYPQQVKAAIALTQRYILQMDTGEGKTYALLPAAFALACQYGKSYIVCANDYLAWRDASRTRTYWNSLGIDPGLATDGNINAEWSRRIVYTTLDAIIFKSLRDEISPLPPQYPLIRGSVLLDDADAILLDNARQSYSLILELAGSAFDWKQAVRLASTLSEGEHIEVNRADIIASLTVSGTLAVRKEAENGQMSPTDYLLLRTAVEAAFLGTRVVQEDADYCVEGQRVHSINRKTGQIDRNKTYTWMLPLEFERGFPLRSTAIYLHSTSPAVFFDAFEHMAGLSGTIAGDALEYAFTYQLWTATIPPRRPRQLGLRQDIVFQHRPAALKYLSSEVLRAAGSGRPVLVGVQTIDDATAVSQALRPVLPADIELRILTAKNERDMAEVFALAGQSGSVVVATQLAGRGVDIRLADDARARGGLALFCLGHALDRRHDLQFMGRAGRQGDPFTVRFINTFDDSFFRVVGTDTVQNIMKRVGLREDQELEHPLLSRSILIAQRRLMEREFLRRLNLAHTKDADIQVGYVFQEWSEYLQTLGGVPQPPGSLEECSQAFQDFNLDRFSKTTVASLCGGARELSEKEAEEIAERLSIMLECDSVALLRGRDIEGLQPDAVLERVKSHLQKALEAAFERNARFRTAAQQCEMELFELRWKQDRETRQKGTVTWVLQELSSRIEEGAKVSRPGGDFKIESGSPDLASSTALDPDAVEAPARLGQPSGFVEEPMLTASLPEIQEFRESQGEAASGPINDPPIPAADQAGTGVVLPAYMPNSGHIGDDGRMSHPAGQILSWNDSAGEPRSRESVLGVLMEALRRANTPEQQAALKQRTAALLDEIDQESMATTDAIARKSAALPPEALRKRTPRQIASWTLKTAWLSYLAERDRIIHRAGHTAEGLDYGRFVSDRFVQRWQQIEGGLPTEMLRNLLKAGEPRKLDKLFYLEDNQSTAATVPVRTTNFEWRSSPESLMAATAADQDQALVELFVVEQGEELHDLELSDLQIRRTLNDFLTRVPLHTLQSTEQVLNAMAEAFTLDLERGIARSRARANRKCLRQFLLFLRKRQRVAKLPTSNQWYLSGLRRALRSTTERTSLLSLAGAGAFTLFFALASYFGALASLRPLEGLWQLADNLLCAGWLAEGRITAPAMAVLLLGYVVARIQSPWMQPQARGEGWDRFLVPVLQVLAAAWLAGWPEGPFTVAALSKTLAIFAASFLCAWLTQRFSWLFTSTSGVSVEAGWLCFTIPFAVLPELASRASGTSHFAMWTLALVGFFLGWNQLNRMEVVLVSQHVPGTVGLGRSETMTHSHQISGDPGAASHVFAALIGWLVCDTAAIWDWGRTQVAGNLEVAGALGIGVYVVVLTLWTWLVLDKRLSFALWLQRLNRNHQCIEGVNDGAQLARRLRTFRRALLMREYLGQGIAVVLCATFSIRFGFMNNGFPAAMIMLASTFLLASCLRSFLTEGYKHFLSRVPFSQTILDMASLPEPRENEGERFERLKHFLQHRIGFTFVIIYLLIELIHILLKLLHH